MLALLFLLTVINADCVIKNTTMYNHEIISQVVTTNNTAVNLVLNSPNDAQCVSIQSVYYEFLIRNNYLRMAYIDAMDKICIGLCNKTIMMDSVMTKNYNINFKIFVPGTTVLEYKIIIVYQLADDIISVIVPVTEDDNFRLIFGSTSGGIFGMIILISVVAIIIDFRCRPKPTESTESTESGKPDETIEMTPNDVSLTSETKSNVNLSETAN